MLVQHHPSPTTRAEYERGELAPGAARVVAIHLEYCWSCANAALSARSIGSARTGYVHPDGALDAPTAISSDQWRLPRSLSGVSVGRWLWAGFGVRIAHLSGSAGLGEHLYLLKAKAGAALLHHSHDAIERVVVLSGSFTDGEQVYRLGDVAESDGKISHRPRATADGPCICLVATEAPLKLSGLARWVQPLLGV